MAKIYPVVGVKPEVQASAIQRSFTQDSDIQPRLEIRDLQKKPIQFSLFIRAFNKILNMRNFEDAYSPDYINKPNSWWQMASIHGLPYTPWSGDPTGKQAPEGNSKLGGYCFHNSVLFPTWHRVSLLLVEQALVKEAVEIAKEIVKRPDDNKKWLAEAKKLRLPFWDWSMMETADEGIPLVFQLPKIEISNPDDTFSLVNNPLNHYRFTLRPGIIKGFEYMDAWQRTFRWADDLYNPTEDRYTRAHEAFSRGQAIRVSGATEDRGVLPINSLREKVASLFNYPLTLPPDQVQYCSNVWGLFASMGANAASETPTGEDTTTIRKTIYIPKEVKKRFPNGTPNIEEPHNQIHLNVGGTGTMAVNEYSAFDPIFVLHHCNVDRIYAFWEYIYPDYTIGDGWKDEQGATQSFLGDEAGNYSQAPDAQVNKNTPLVPFRTDAQGNPYWTSENARSLLENAQTKKYYTYPSIGVPREADETTEKFPEIRVHVDISSRSNYQELRERYRQALYTHWNEHLRDSIGRIEAVSKSASPPLNPTLYSRLLRKEDIYGYLCSFIALGEVPEFAFEGSYDLQLYLRPKLTEDNIPMVIGTTSVLGRANPKGCASCIDRQAAGSIVRGHMSLDHMIVLRLISLFKFDQDHVKSLWPKLTYPNPPDDTSLTLEFLAELIKASLGMRLVRPDGSLLASPTKDVSVTEQLEDRRIPKVTLSSNLIEFDWSSLDSDRARTSISYKGSAVDHGEVVPEDNWNLALGVYNPDRM